MSEGEATEQRIKRLHHPTLRTRGQVESFAAMKTARSTIEPVLPARHGSRRARDEAYRLSCWRKHTAAAVHLPGWLADCPWSCSQLRSAEARKCGAFAVPDGGRHAVVGRRGVCAPRRRHRRSPTFVAPLWKIADATEQALMDGFTKSSAPEGRAGSAAGRQLDCSTIRGRPAFFQWAPVILPATGPCRARALFAKHPPPFHFKFNDGLERMVPLETELRR